MREVEEVREQVLALVREAHGRVARLRLSKDGEETYTTLIGNLIAWSLNYAVDVIDGCQIGLGQEDLDDAIDWIARGALLDTLGCDRDGR